MMQAIVQLLRNRPSYTVICADRAEGDAIEEHSAFDARISARVNTHVTVKIVADVCNVWLLELTASIPVDRLSDSYPMSPRDTVVRAARETSVVCALTDV